MPFEPIEDSEDFFGDKITEKGLKSSAYLIILAG